MQKDIMIDLETMGNGHSPVICSIGAAYFDFETGKVIDTFYRLIDMHSCELVGMKYDASTILFWLEQCADARFEITKSDRISIFQALGDFCIWFRKHDLLDSRIWANGIHSDLVWLKSAYNLCNMSAPWGFRLERDVRTLVNFMPEIKKYRATIGTAHNALDDCINQIGYCVEIMKRIKTNRL